MEIIIPQKEKKAVHPILIFRESWGICRKNLRQLGVIYLIFNLLIGVIYLTPAGSKLQKQEMDLFVFVFAFLPIAVLSLWENISLILGAKKAADREPYTVSQPIGQARLFFLKYLGTSLIITVFLAGLIILGAIFVAGLFPALLKVNKILAISVCLAIIIADVGFLVYFLFRWALAAVVCVLENAGPVVSLKRSFFILKDYIHPLAGTYCLFILLYASALFIFIAVFTWLVKEPAQHGWMVVLLGTAINIILIPFWTVITVVLYKKLKEVSETHVCP